MKKKLNLLSLIELKKITGYFSTKLNNFFCFNK
jgi:hypothetical protein